MSNAPNIRIGNQTAFSVTPIEVPFYYALDNGFEAFEWFPDKKPSGGWDETNLDKGLRFHFRNLAGARAVRMSVHARWQANPLDPQTWPLLLNDLELASDLGAVLLNIHLYTEAGIDAYVRAITP